MKVLWICGLPNIVRVEGAGEVISPTPTAAWSWIMGHLPPPNGIELHVICPVGGLKKTRIDFKYLGVHWHCFKQHRFELPMLWIRFYLQIKSFVKDLNPDVIHGWGGETGCGRVATLLSNKAIVSVQGLLLLFWQLLNIEGERRVNFSTRLAWFCEKKTYDGAKILLVESEASKEGLKQYYDKRSVLIPHPLRQEFLEAKVSSGNSEKIKFVFVGSLVDRKGAMDAVRAFSMVQSDDIELVMIGSGPDALPITKFISQKGLEKKIRLVGNLSVKDLVLELSDAQFFLLPSYGDTGPTALKEALSMGLYPICYRNSGPENLIHHYECGKLVRTGDIDALSGAISDCTRNMSKYSECARQTSMFVRSELSRTNVWKELQTIYLQNQCN